ncbi:MAG: DEAD/DEAH box helicase [Bacteroidia bacterium]|nr:DEAD/DEAH box helicase [Bacteroidia bacterium]
MSFKSFNLSEKIVSSLERQGYLSPSSIQTRVIPKALKGENIVAQSETGSGKTHAFLIPIMEKLDLESSYVQAIIVTPTRELAKQIHTFAEKFHEAYPNFRTRLFTGGKELDKTYREGMLVPHLVVGTPTRIKAIIADMGLLDLSHVQTLVLDEADMLMEMGYFTDIDVIFKKLKHNPQVMVFSATIEFNLRQRLEKYVGADFMIEMDDVRTAKTVMHHAIDIKHGDPLLALELFITTYNPYLLIVFASRKEDVATISSYLKSKGHDNIMLHGDMGVRERKNAYKLIEANKHRIIVASDLAARGLDIRNVSEVLNFDLPKDLTYYFHRAGRTGRFGQQGQCYSFYNVETSPKIEALIKEGVTFTYHELKNNVISACDTISRRKAFKRSIDPELERKIKFATSKTKSNVVKPGYKRKVRDAVAKVKRKHKREIIRKDIRRQRVERYRKEGKGNE